MIRTLALAVALAAAVVAGGVRTAVAQQLAPSVVAVVDFEKILRESTAGQGLRKQMDGQRDKYQAEIAQRETELRAEKDSLEQQKSILSAEVFAQKRQEFEDKVASVQRLVQGHKQTLDQAYEKGLDAIKQSVTQILGEFAKEQGFNLVLPLRQVLLVDSKFDLTDEVMAQLDTRLPNVTVSFAE